MPFHLVRIEDCPPDDQPWLVSSRRELKKSATDLQKWRDLWTAAFPGAASSYGAKLAWAHEIEEEPLQDFDKMMDPTRPFSTSETLAEILYEACPETVMLQIVVAREMLDALLKHLKSAEAGFFTCAERRQGGAETPEGYVSWLRDAAAGTSVGGDLMLLASCEAKKAESADDVALALLKRLGMETATLATPSGPGLRYAGALCEVRDRLGEMPHFPEGARQAVALELLDFGKVRGRAAEKSAFLEGLESRVKASEGTLTCFHFSRKLGEEEEEEEEDEEEEEEEESDEGEEPSAENSHVLWLPREYDEVRERMQKHRGGFGETEEMKRRLDKGSTDSGNLMINLFDAELNAIKAMKGKQLPSKLCAMLALTQTMADDTYWLHDNEFPEAAAGLLRDVSGYWRNTLLCHKNSNEALGLGLPEARGSSREALEFFLRFLGRELEAASHVPVKFNCVPGPPRKRQRPSEDSEVVGRARLR